MGGKGGVLMVSGLPGNPDNTLFEKGAHSVFDNCPGIKVVQTLEANWDPATAKSMTLQYLETHRGQKIDGVWDSSGMAIPAIQAFQTAGVPVPAVVNGNPDKGYLAYWKANKDKGFIGGANALPSASGADAAMRVALKVLQGQGLKVSDIPAQIPTLTVDDLAAPDRQLLRTRANRMRWATALSRPWALAAGLTILLIVVNTLVQPQFAAPQYIGGNLDLFAPLALAAVASTPSILAGGIDVSIGPLLGLVNILVVSPVLPPALQGPLITPVVCLAVGAGVGIVNGLIVAVVRIQPVVATIGTYLILAGLDVKLLPTPAGPAPDWAVQLQAGIGPIPGSLLLMAAPLVVWAALRAIPYHKALLALGGDEPAAFSTGMNTAAVKVIAYGLGGLFAAVAGVALSSGLSAADATLGPQYTVVAIAAVALGGTSLAGGRGGLTEAFLGALVIFLIQSLLAALGLTSLWLPLIYGSILVVSLVIGSRLTTGAGMRRGGV